jgi:hypothetical protein
MQPGSHDLNIFLVIIIYQFFQAFLAGNHFSDKPELSGRWPSTSTGKIMKRDVSLDQPLMVRDVHGQVHHKVKEVEKDIECRTPEDLLLIVFSHDKAGVFQEIIFKFRA